MISSTRRTFLAGCVAVAGAATVTLPSAGSERSGARPDAGHGPLRAIFDRDFAEARSFASAARALGMATHAIAGDVTSLWYDDLYFRWRTSSEAVTGLTGVSALFCLERLAWDACRRVVLRVNHERAADGTVRHVFHGPRALRPAAARVLGSSVDWGTDMARLAALCPAESSTVASCPLPATGALSAPWSEPLVSWVIAPRRAGPAAIS